MGGLQEGLPNDGGSEGEGFAFAEEAVGKEMDGEGEEVVVELFEVVGDEGDFSEAGGDGGGLS